MAHTVHTTPLPAVNSYVPGLSPTRAWFAALLYPLRLQRLTLYCGDLGLLRLTVATLPRIGLCTLFWLVDCRTLPFTDLVRMFAAAGLHAHGAGLTLPDTPLPTRFAGRDNALTATDYSWLPYDIYSAPLPVPMPGTGLFLWFNAV